MLHLDQIKIPVDAAPEQWPELLRHRAARLLHRQPAELSEVRITRQSLDFRDREHPFRVFSADVFLRSEKLPAARAFPLSRLKPHPDPFKTDGSRKKPVVIGFGPAGMFCALTLARAGLCPVILERGDPVEARTESVRRFWENGILDPESNVQFGEGGAGTFSDGKLNTLVREKKQLGRIVLETFAEAGADASILTDAKPHIGTDVLREVVKNIRAAIRSFGGTFFFRTRAAGFETENGRLCGVRAQGRNGEKLFFETDRAFLCIGHSARDTFEELLRAGVRMERKAFAMGLRIEHPQELINRAQYGRFAAHPLLSEPADYKLAYHTESGRGVYTFCMCPGGYVVNAASEPDQIVTNGMSNAKRESPNANSALLVGISPEDTLSWGNSADDVLSGMRFQRELEKRAFRLGGCDYAVPAEPLSEFLQISEKNSIIPAGFASCFCGKTREGALHAMLPDFMVGALREGLPALNQKLKGFADPRAVLTGIEARSSSPVRILRAAETFESSMPGLYPVGEGAGYAGGITSAAMDGIRAAEAVYPELQSENAGE